MHTMNLNTAQNITLGLGSDPKIGESESIEYVCFWKILVMVYKLRS